MADIRKTTSAVEDAVAYPILTKEVGGTPSGGATSAGVTSGSGQSLDARAQDSIRQALGWRYRVDDTKGFVAALRKAFVLTEVEGHTEWNYQPQSYSVQADMGEITGAQASIYARAKNALDQTLPLLNGLTPLLSNPDFEDIESMRSIVRDELAQLVAEFGQVAGPRVQRVESIFNLLIGPKPDYAKPEGVKGHLGLLGDRLGMSRRWVNSIEDEQDLTNFLILVDYVNSLYQTWVAQRDCFSRGKFGQPFLGTQLVMISRALASVVDQVQDVCDAMDSVYLGAAERQTTMLNFFGEFAEITVAELLNWVFDFSTNEGPQLLQEAGKDGVVAFRATVNRLDYLMFLTLELSKADGTTGGRPFHTYRVQVALGDLYKSLHLVDTEANKIRRAAPGDKSALTAEGDVFSIKALLEVDYTPASPTSGTTQITVGGRNIKPEARMRLISRKNPNSGAEDLDGQSTFAEPVTKGEGKGSFNQMTASFLVSPAFPMSGDSYTLVVVNPDGEEYAWLPEPLEASLLTPAFDLVVSPTITGAFIKKSRSGVYSLIIKGADFETDATNQVTCQFTRVSGSAWPFTPATPPVVGAAKSSEEVEVSLGRLVAGAGSSQWTITITNTTESGGASLRSSPFPVNLP